MTSPEADAGTLGVTRRVVTSWVIDAIRNWLPGITGTDPDLAAQFRIRYLGPRRNYEHIDRYEVTTVDGHDPRVFSIVVVALED